MTACARSGESQSLGSSTAAFSSASRRFARSQSKMPPQQANGLLDPSDNVLDFGAHSGFRLWLEMADGGPRT
jgi:hypothetical protein